MLRDVQRWMASVILEPARLGDTDEALRTLDASIVTPPRGSAATRLHAYVNGYPARLNEALAEAFPAIEHVVGAATFVDLVERYLPCVPAGGYNLTDVGAVFADFLRDDVVTEDLPFLPDLAELEWAVQRAFHASEQQPLDPSCLSGWTLDDFGRAVLGFQPAVAIVASDWPIRDVWAAREQPRDDIDIELVGRPDRVLVYRVGFRVACESIGEGELACLRALLSGASLAEATAALAERGDGSDDAAALFSRWSALGLITTCVPAGAAPVGG